MAFWIFKSKPDRYNLAGRLEDLRPIITHTVPQHKDEVHPGDTVFLWESGANRGIKGVMLVLEGPRFMPELSSERQYWVDPAGASVEDWRIVGALIRSKVDLPMQKLKDTIELKGLTALRRYGAPDVVYPVTEGHGRILLDLVRQNLH